MRKINIIIDSNDLDVSQFFAESCQREISAEDYQLSFVGTTSSSTYKPSQDRVTYTHMPLNGISFHYYFDDSAPDGELSDQQELKGFSEYLVPEIKSKLAIESDEDLRLAIKASELVRRTNVLTAELEEARQSILRSAEATQAEINALVDKYQYNEYKPSTPHFFSPSPQLQRGSQSQNDPNINCASFLRKLGIIGLSMVGIGALALMMEPLAWIGGVALFMVSPTAFFITLAVVVTVIAASLLGALLLYKWDQSAANQTQEMSSSFVPA